MAYDETAAQRIRREAHVAIATVLTVLIIAAFIVALVRTVQDDSTKVRIAKISACRSAHDSARDIALCIRAA